MGSKASILSQVNIRMGSANIKATKTETCPLDLEDEFATSIVRGVKDYKEGRVTVCHNKDEVLKHLNGLLH